MSARPSRRRERLEEGTGQASDVKETQDTVRTIAHRDAPRSLPVACPDQTPSPDASMNVTPAKSRTNRSVSDASCRNASSSIGAVEMSISPARARTATPSRWISSVPMRRPPPPTTKCVLELARAVSRGRRTRCSRGRRGRRNLRRRLGLRRPAAHRARIQALHFAWRVGRFEVRVATVLALLGFADRLQPHRRHACGLVVGWHQVDRAALVGHHPIAESERPEFRHLHGIDESRVSCAMRAVMSRLVPEPCESETTESAPGIRWPGQLVGPVCPAPPTRTEASSATNSTI